MTEDAPVRELRFALDAYVNALETWRERIIAFNQEAKVQDPGVGPELTDPTSESELYRHAQILLRAKAVGDLP